MVGRTGRCLILRSAINPAYSVKVPRIGIENFAIVADHEFLKSFLNSNLEFSEVIIDRFT